MIFLAFFSGLQESFSKLKKSNGLPLTFELSANVCEGKIFETL